MIVGRGKLKLYIVMMLNMYVEYSHGFTEHVSRSWNALPGSLWLGFVVAALEVELVLLV